MRQRSESKGAENCCQKTVLLLLLFCKDSAILPAVMELEESEMSKELKENARASLEHFLQVKKRENYRTSAQTDCKIDNTSHFFIVLFPGTRL